MNVNQIIEGSAEEVLKTLPDESVNCCISSPPYWALRDYGVAGQLGLEPTFEEYISKLCDIYDEIKRVLRKDGTCFVNLGDTYSAKGTGRGQSNQSANKGDKCDGFRSSKYLNQDKIDTTYLAPAKSLCLIPQRFAIEMVNRGWILRNVIIWCLGGSTRLYVRSQKGDMPMTIKDMARLNPSTVKLWNGKQWTQLTKIKKQKRADGIQITLRSGEVITCTPEHKWPTLYGLKNASELKIGDILNCCKLPQPDLFSSPQYIPAEDVGWMLGFYLAEGSIDPTNTIQFSVHSEETQAFLLIRQVAERYGAAFRIHRHKGKSATICVDGKVFRSVIKTYISGKTAYKKHLSVNCWQRSDVFLHHLLLGYLAGDGHYEGKNHRWRLGFTRNYNLEKDIRTICARLNLPLTLNKAISKFNGKEYKSFRGEVRTGGNVKKPRNEIVKIEKAKGRIFYEIGVKDDPHLFALASGVLTHNSKPNPMPSSAKDRFTVDFEYVYFFVRSRRYWFEPQYEPSITPSGESTGNTLGTVDLNNKKGWGKPDPNYTQSPLGRNKRAVWIIPTQPFAEAHFATFPEKLVEPMIKAGCPEFVCTKCGKAREKIYDIPYDKDHPRYNEWLKSQSLNTKYNGKQPTADGKGGRGYGSELIRYYTEIWGQKSSAKIYKGYTDCGCGVEFKPGIVLDPFAGSGTVGLVAAQQRRDYIMIELKPEYIEMMKRRINTAETGVPVKEQKAGQMALLTPKTAIDTNEFLL